LRKIVAYILLLFFLFNSAGYYLLFELDKFMVKKEMHLALENGQDDLIILKVNNADHNRDFSRTEKHEIEYKGLLYDVVREIVHGPNHLFICLHDQKEEGLYTGLKKATVHKLHLSLWDHVVKISFPDLPDTPVNAPMAALTFPRISETVISLPLPSWSPPPETV